MQTNVGLVLDGRGMGAGGTHQLCVVTVMCRVVGAAMHPKCLSNHSIILTAAANKRSSSAAAAAAVAAAACRCRCCCRCCMLLLLLLLHAAAYCRLLPEAAQWVVIRE